jgi:general stress protein YciG
MATPGRRHPAVNEYIQRITSMGGKARAEALSPRRRRQISRKGGRKAQALRTPEERSASARKAARARWAKRR